MRQIAIEWLSNITNDDFVMILPQLLEALKHETWNTSPLAKLMLERSLMSPKVSHALFWHIAQSIKGRVDKYLGVIHKPRGQLRGRGVSLMTIL